jgi:hypothetical protein
MILLVVGIRHNIVRIAALFDNSMQKSNSMRLFNHSSSEYHALNPGNRIPGNVVRLEFNHKVIQRGVYATSGKRNPGYYQPHLHPGQGVRPASNDLLL